MCAIAGVIGKPLKDSTIEAMLATMARRGPDDRGVYRQEDISLLHSRLAIVDLEGGRQPMELRWGGETYILVYNGELYNTEELRRELTRLGHRFLGHSDTEVLLHGYAQWGENVVDKCNGIFAFGVWEVGRKRLFLARDRIGVKPLFFTQQGDMLIFGSEIKTILACPGMKAELDGEGVAQIFLLGPGRLPGSGVFRGIREVEPGWCGYWEQGKLALRQYWKLKDREHGENFDQTAEIVRYLVTDAIRRQMVSDVPIGTFLSGGLDSSLISAICAKEMEKKGEKLQTFSVDYLNNDQYFKANKFQPNSDGYFINLMKENLGCEHRLTVLSPEDLTQVLEAATEARDLPGMADVDFSLLAFCGDIREKVKVTLSGECADEIFGGYPWYRDPEIREKVGFPWAQNTVQRLGLLRKGVYGEEFVMDAYLDTCRQSDVLPGTSPEEKRMKQMVNLNFRWFMQTLLDRKDRMSMYQSLEVRVPFCDYRIAEYLYGVPWEYKDYQGKEKGLLRHAMEGALPEEVLWRKKSPYPKTFDPKYTELVRCRLEGLLAEKSSPLLELVKDEEIRKIMEEDGPWPWYGQLMRRPQIMAYLLQIDHWLRHYRVDVVL